MKDITHNLEVAKPNFLYFINNMNTELSQHIQYVGVEQIGNELSFKFKSSQNPLNFNIYAGVNTDKVYYLLKGKSNIIYDYFKELKYNQY